MTAAEIVIYPNEILRTVCEPVEAFGDEIGPIIQTMRATMAAAAGIGLAGPQIGVARQVCHDQPRDRLALGGADGAR
jgi:peptide deformylase